VKEQKKKRKGPRVLELHVEGYRAILEGKKSKENYDYIWKTMEGYGKLPVVYSQKASPPQTVCC
jgi:hypothetical protein